MAGNIVTGRRVAEPAAARSVAATDPIAAGTTAAPAIGPEEPAANARPAGGDNALVRVFGDARLPGARGRYDDFLPDVEAISVRRRSPYATWLIYTLSLMVVAVVSWMHLSRFDEMATAPGIVWPAGDATAVSHPDGGRVAQVLVKDGDSVRADEPLVALDAAQALREIARLAAIHRAHLAEVLRLEAETSESSTAPRFAPDPGSEIAASQLMFWQVRQIEIERRRNAADSLVERTRADIMALRVRIVRTEDWERELARLHSSSFSRVDHGAQATPRADALHRELIDTRGALRTMHDELRVAKRALAAASERRLNVDRAWRAANVNRLADAVAERDRAKAALDRQERGERGLILRAPVDGVVKNLGAVKAGSIIRPGEPVAGVVPTDEAGRIEIEARVSSGDIGAIAVGQGAIVSLHAYDRLRYGTLKGTVAHVASKAIVPDPAMPSPAAAASHPYFIVRIAIDKTFLGDDPRRNRLLPGMTARVDLRIGERSILGYVTGDLFRSAGTAGGGG